MKDLNKDILSAYVDNEVEGKPLKIVESHLKKCETCRNYVEAVTSLKNISKSTLVDCDYETSIQRVKNSVNSFNFKPQKSRASKKVLFFRIAFSVFLLIIFSFIFIIVSGRVVTKDSSSQLVQSEKSDTIKDEEVKSIAPDYSNIKSVDY